MVKREEQDFDVFSNDVFLHNEIGSSSGNRPTRPISAKEVKLEDDDSDSCGNIFVYRDSAPINARPISPPSHVKQENSSCSFHHYLRSSFIAMGFSAALVDNVIKENGDQDENMLLETLIKNSQSSPHLRQSSPQSSDSWGQFSTDDNIEEEKPPTEFTTGPKQELEDLSELSSTGWLDKRSSLASMEFSDKDIDLAISRLGVNASLAELVDFIVTSQTSISSAGNEENEECLTAKLFGTMDKTLCLLQMGFSEIEVSLAIEALGPEAPVGMLAESIFSKRMPFAVDKKEEDIWDDLPNASNQCQNQIYPEHLQQKIPEHSNSSTYPWTARASNPNPNDIWARTDPWTTRAPNPNPNDSWSRNDLQKTKTPNLNPDEGWIRKESTSKPYPPDNYDDDDVKAVKRPKPTTNLDEASVKKSKPTYTEDQYDWNWTDDDDEDKDLNTEPDQYGEVKEEFPYTQTPSTSNTSSKLPYFFYANTVDVSQSTWNKLSQFLYVPGPEFANSQFFSAFYRKEGYLHNLPKNNRFYILPKPPTTIEETLPHTKKWWPSWDTRKQLSCLSSDTAGTVQLCDRLSKMMMDSQGFLSKERQTEIMHHCKKSNLIWVGLHKLIPIQPNQVEMMLGYPENHTEVLNLVAADRLRLLRDAIQVDTIGYHLSVLKSIFPDGVRVLSVFTGVGGAIVALHKLGIWLKCVVSVEAMECNRKILKRWWQNTEQCGELRQIKGIDRLTSQTVENYVKEYGGFDVVVGCNPGDVMRAGNRDGSKDMDLNLFFEFVRVLQRVRGMMGRNG